MKKLLAWILAALLLLSLTACLRTKAFDPKQVDLRSVRKETGKTVRNLYVLKYDENVALSSAVKHPDAGYLYLTVYTDDDYDLAICKTNGKVVQVYNHEKLFQAAKKANWKGDDFDRAIFLETAYNKAMEAASGQLRQNAWYRFSAEEVSALVGDRNVSSDPTK